MLFNSVEFIFLFLPITLFGFFCLARLGQNYATAWLFAASLSFYSWWDWHYVGLLLGSIAFHFYIGTWLTKLNQIHKKRLLVGAIGFDLSALVYFKYADMFIGTWNLASSHHIALLNVVLPLGISFFTFTQIAYLIDVYDGKVKEVRALHFGLFVTYFPHLIAGPVLHHKEMMPQFANPLTYRLRLPLIALGTSIFVIGLGKKVLIADNLSSYAGHIFQPQADIQFMQAWIGILAYSFQLYFDFSGYSDMAVGLSILFGIKLPINFYSPYKARNISEFWRRWHMTLSRFLRDYLYIRMGGNRLGKTRRYFNLIITMFLGGMWHGAGWNFAVWGLLHGAFLCLHEAWRASFGRLIPVNKLFQRLAVVVTFTGVVFAWVPFRASNLDMTLTIWKSMVGLGGFSLPEVAFSLFPKVGEFLRGFGVSEAIGGGQKFTFGIFWIFISAVTAFLAPNTMQIHRRFKAAIIEPSLLQPQTNKVFITARFQKTWALCVALLFALCLLSLSKPSEFLYFQF